MITVSVIRLGPVVEDALPGYRGDGRVERAPAGVEVVLGARSVAPPTAETGSAGS
jgi:hypothetical protein